MIALGCDPGFAFVGIGVLLLTASRVRVLHHDTLRTTAKMTAPERMDLICDRVLELLELHKPEVMGYENQAGVEAGKAKLMLEDPTKVHSNASSRRVHEVVGALRCAARIHRLPCYEVAPATVKVSLLGKGGGRGSKAQVKQAVSRMLGVSCSEHAADALAVAVATGRRHAIELAKQRAALGLIS